jgi:hypothetical protein
MLQRFAVMPVVATVMVELGEHWGFIKGDPLLVFILLMQGCMPR